MVKSWKKAGWLFLALPLAAGSAFGDPADSAPFKPHWGFMVGFNSAGTPGDRGGGQNANDLTFTVSREFSETGNFLSLGIMGGQQKIEGSPAKYGGLTLDGGLGLGFFSPSLSLAAQTGEAALFSLNGGLNLGFQIFNDWNVGLNFSGGFSSHQLPASTLLPIPGVTDALVELDGKNIAGGLSLTWATSEIFSLSLSGQTSNEITYQVQNLAHTKKLALNQSSLIPSSSIGFVWAFLKDFALSGSFQRSAETQPASFSYSPSLGQTVFNTEATTLYFSGYNLGLTYSFQ